MRSFKVEVLFGVHKTSLVLTAGNTSHAMVIAKKVYPNGKIISATEIK